LGFAPLSLLGSLNECGETSLQLSNSPIAGKMKLQAQILGKCPRR